MRKDAPPTVGERRRTPHRGGTHAMKISPLSERPVTEEEEQDVPRPDITPQEALPSSQESSTAPVGNGYRAHRTGGCGSCWCLHAGREHRLVERSPQHRGNTHRAPRAHAVSIERTSDVRRLRRSAPTESSCAPPSSRQTPTPNRNYPRQPKKTANAAQKPRPNTTSRCCVLRVEHGSVTQPFADTSSATSEFASGYVAVADSTRSIRMDGPTDWAYPQPTHCGSRALAWSL